MAGRLSARFLFISSLDKIEGGGFLPYSCSCSFWGCLGFGCVLGWVIMTMRIESNRQTMPA